MQIEVHAGQGLTGRRLDDDFAHTLRVLATAPRTFYAFYHRLDEDTRSALVVGAKVLATIHADTITLRPVRSAGVPMALVRALPPAPKGGGEPLSVSADELAAGPDRAGVASRRPAGPAARMRWLLSQRRVGGGQLYAARRDRRGRRVVCARPLSYFDLATGRYLATEEAASDGATWRGIVPADSVLIAERLAALLPAR
jgi:ESX secretion-associated protein EspG